jgi:hypothetical protein
MSLIWITMLYNVKNVYNIKLDFVRAGSTSYQTGRDGSAYTVYPGDFDRRRGSPPGRRGGRGRYY